MEKATLEHVYLNFNSSLQIENSSTFLEIRDEKPEKFSTTNRALSDNFIPLMNKYIKI